jgi:hypothetical protein
MKFMEKGIGKLVNILRHPQGQAKSWLTGLLVILDSISACVVVLGVSQGGIDLLAQIPFSNRLPLPYPALDGHRQQRHGCSRN